MFTGETKAFNFQQLSHVFCPHQKHIFDVSLSIDFEERDLSAVGVFYTKKGKNEKGLLDYKYFKFNFSVAGL